jgi:hypothetical protein
MYIAISLEENRLTIAVNKRPGFSGKFELTDSGQFSYVSNGISLSEFSETLKKSRDTRDAMLDKLRPKVKDRLFTALESLAEILDDIEQKPN